MGTETDGAVIFDLYETLVTEFDPCWRAAPLPADILGVPQDIFDRVWRDHKAARMTSTVDFRDVLRRACAAAEIAADERIVEDLYQARLATKARPFATIDPAVLEALTALRTQGHTIGLVSNCSVEEVAAWPRCALAPLIDVTVFSYDIGLAKPDPAIYRHACAQLRIFPQEAVFVGDGGSDELAGAHAAGLRPYRARWFLDRWPPDRHAPAGIDCTELASPSDLLSTR
ncbi:MAG TPA: HAD-IA family hydrolase [Mycobacteriales bacterium]|nr:HAD-IA family hydrolase [Mycobacteriales bacterium]